MTAILVLGALAGADNADPSSRSWGEESRAAFATESLIEAGTHEEMVSARDRARAAAAEARAQLLTAEAASTAALPDSVSAVRIRIVTAAYVRALRQEAVRLHGGGEGDGMFRSIWNEMVRTHLDILNRWPRLRLEDVARKDPGSYLPGQLLLLCSPEAYEGETFSLPRESLFPRLATLPESLAQCCIDARRCVDQQAAPCPDQVTADIARLADLDALVGFRNGRRYWDMPAGVAPRSQSNDAAVARAQAESALGMLQACAGSEAGHGGSAAEVTPPSALSELRAGRRLWPPDSDPFQTLPGLRNPRRDREGRLICDLAISESCLAATHPAALARLTARLAPGARIIPVRPGAAE
jgi:hypothetical protein